jgi:hypothetical protein
MVVVYGLSAEKKRERPRGKQEVYPTNGHLRRMVSDSRCHLTLK